jgi:WhiB family redox-sensing transcriptional regulator
MENGVMSWHKYALCAYSNPESFFPEKGGSTKEAKLVCKKCRVTVECLEWAITADEKHGIWGGMSERERRKYKKEQQAIVV